MQHLMKVFVVILAALAVILALYTVSEYVLVQHSSEAVTLSKGVLKGTLDFDARVSEGMETLLITKKGDTKSQEYSVDESGVFKIPLSAGVYTVTLKDPLANERANVPQNVPVREGKITTFNIIPTSTE